MTPVAGDVGTWFSPIVNCHTWGRWGVYNVNYYLFIIKYPWKVLTCINKTISLLCFDIFWKPVLLQYGVFQTISTSVERLLGVPWQGNISGFRIPYNKFSNFSYVIILTFVFRPTSHQNQFILSPTKEEAQLQWTCFVPPSTKFSDTPLVLLTCLIVSDLIFVIVCITKADISRV